MRYTGPKNRLARREKLDLGLKTPGSKSYSNLMRKLNISPGQRQSRGAFKKKLTEYGYQLREKQKLKRMYGVTEKQMKNYFNKASKSPESTADSLIQILERRLDNVIYKLGFAPTRSSARQLVSHGHIRVDNKKITIPSYLVNIGETIIFHKKKSMKIPYIAQMLEKKDFILPSWLKRDGPAGKLIGKPKKENIKEVINLQSVIEFYSR
jgi:small subunit ribosomal protein S4